MELREWGSIRYPQPKRERPKHKGQPMAQPRNFPTHSASSLAISCQLWLVERHCLKEQVEFLPKPVWLAEADQVWTLWNP